MNTMKKNLLSLTVIWILAVGCASTPAASRWYQEGKTQEDVTRDLARCRLEAERTSSGQVTGWNAGSYFANAAGASVHKKAMIEDGMVALGYRKKSK